MEDTNGSPSPLEPPASAVRPQYEVVLSFRGTDSRRHFGNRLFAGFKAGRASSYSVMDFVNGLLTGFGGADTKRHLANRLLTSFWGADTDAEIRVFKDKREPKAGEEIDPALVEAIGQSKISILIISPESVSSKSCLAGLTKMLDCRDTKSHAIIPIFYGVNPSDIGSSTEHQINGALLDSWKSALHDIGQLKGYCLDPASDEDGIGRLISELVSYVTRQLKEAELVGGSTPVGIEKHVHKMMKSLDVDYRNGQAVAIRGNDVRMVGIHGIAGIGKTTLAKFLYGQLYPLFEGCSYLGNIGEVLKTEPLEHLQSQLISDLLKQEPISLGSVEDGIHHIEHRFRSMKVLIVLDDVHGKPQLKAFAGKLSWFGSRSRIIVTTRDTDLRRDIPEMFETHEVGLMDFDQGFRLFCQHAFGGISPPDGYGLLARKVVSKTGRIPIAIEVVGSYLYRQKKRKWKETLKKLKIGPADTVPRVLRISYESLDRETKDIFLDIACFFLGKDKRNPFYMWDACGFYPSSGIENLLLKSLVKIEENNKLSIHDLLRDLGRTIVHEEDPANPGRRSRLWNHKDALDALRRKEGTEKVQALCLKYDSGSHDYLTREEFEGLSKLRFLKLDSANIQGDFTSLLSNLRWLDWQGCPATFGARNLRLDKLVILDLSWSKVTESWEGWSRIEMPRLKVLDLTGCNEMLITPNFSCHPQPPLEKLIVECCSQLVEVHPSICGLTSLVSLNLKSCSNLSMLPPEMGNMEALEELLIDGTSIYEIPESIARLKKLETLSAYNCYSLIKLPVSIRLEALSMLLLDNTKILELPDSIGSSVKLKRLSLRNCQEIEKLPDSIGKLGRSLVELDVSGTLILELPDSMSDLRLLKVLKMERCHFRKFPDAIGGLQKLEEIHASHCRSLEGSIPYDIGNLQFLKFFMLGYTCVSSLPESIQSLSRLQTLDLLACDNLETLPRLPSSLICLQISSKKMSRIPDIANLVELEDLSLGHENPRKLPPPSQFPWTVTFPKLKSLALYHSQIVKLRFEYASECNPQLRKAVLSCANLQEVSGLPSSLSVLSIHACLSLKSVPKVPNSNNLLELELLNSAVEEIEGLGWLTSLEILVVSYCPIVHLNGLPKLKSLKRLSLKNCNSLNRLPDLSNLTMLKALEIHRCPRIGDIEGLEKLTSLEELHVTEYETKSTSRVAYAQQRIRKAWSTSP